MHYVLIIIFCISMSLLLREVNIQHEWIKRFVYLKTHYEDDIDKEKKESLEKGFISTAKVFALIFVMCIAAAKYFNLL